MGINISQANLPTLNPSSSAATLTSGSAISSDASKVGSSTGEKASLKESFDNLLGKTAIQNTAAVSSSQQPNANVVTAHSADSTKEDLSYIDMIKEVLSSDRDYNDAQAQRQMDFQYQSQQDAMAYNSAEAQKQRDWQEYMSNTAHQREVQDLIAAGLNPVLSALNGAGASTPVGASGSASSLSGSKSESRDGSVLGSILGAIISAQASMANAQTTSSAMLAATAMDNNNALQISKNNSYAKVFGDILNFIPGIAKYITPALSASDNMSHSWSNNTSNSVSHNYNYNYRGR